MPSLRRDLPFRRIAVVLSGGGALGAYEVGVLRVLEAAGLRPAIVAGVSIGALNAVVWLAHGFRTFPLERMWRQLRAATVGLRWVTLGWRSLGTFVLLFSVVELLLLLTGTRELSGVFWFWRKSSGRIDLTSTLLEAAAWSAVAALGLAAVLLARPAEEWFARGGGIPPPGVPERTGRWPGRLLLALALLHTAAWLFGWPWPHRFMAVLLLALGALWLATRPGRGDLHSWMKRLFPETAGRGLWGPAARRRVLEDLLAEPGATPVAETGTRLIVSALAVDSGQVCHFVSGPEPEPEFRARAAHELGEVIPMRDNEDVVRSALASSAIPGLFEPVRIGGRDFVDAGGFSNQPLHVALAAGADAALVVLLSPTQVSGGKPPRDLVELFARLLEIANWRDMQTELRNLPPGWDARDVPSRLCVVEPGSPLPGSLLGFGPANAAELIALGDRDVRLALERAGWLEPETAPVAAAATATATAPR